MTISYRRTAIKHRPDAAPIGTSCCERITTKEEIPGLFIDHPSKVAALNLQLMSTAGITTMYQLGLTTERQHRRAIPNSITKTPQKGESTPILREGQPFHPMQPPHTTPAFRSATFLKSSHHPAGKATTPAYTPSIGSPKIHIRRPSFSSNHSQTSTLCFTITIVDYGCHFCERAGIFGPFYKRSGFLYIGFHEENIRNSRISRHMRYGAG